MSRRPTDHATGVRTDRVDLAGPFVNRDDRRLERHNATATLIDDGIRSPQIDRKPALRPVPQAGQTGKTHRPTVPPTTTASTNAANARQEVT